jgi:hypothetical protein
VVSNETGAGPAKNIAQLSLRPLFTGAIVVAIAFTIVIRKSGWSLSDAVSLSASALATFAIGTAALTMLVDGAASAYRKLPAKVNRFLTLDRIVPAAMLFGLGIGCLIWQ